jgi:hypothetical protein
MTAIFQGLPEEPSPVGQGPVALRGTGYLADVTASTIIHLGAVPEKPVPMDGPAGAAKTPLAKRAASATRKVPYPAAGKSTGSGRRPEL